MLPSQCIVRSGLLACPSHFLLIADSASQIDFCRSLPPTVEENLANYKSLAAYKAEFAAEVADAPSLF